MAIHLHNTCPPSVTCDTQADWDEYIKEQRALREKARREMLEERTVVALERIAHAQESRWF